MNQTITSTQAAMSIINANVASIFHGTTTPNKMVEIFSKFNELMEIYCLPMKQKHPRTLAFVVTSGVVPTDPYEAEMQALIPLIQECFLVKDRVNENALSMLETFCPGIEVSAHITAKNGRNLICFHNQKRQGLRYESFGDKITLSFIPPLRTVQ